MLWDEGYVSRLIFTLKQVDGEKEEEVKLSSAIVRWSIDHDSSTVSPPLSRKTGCGRTGACWL